MAGIVYCHQCQKVLTRTKTRQEACNLAVLHCRMTPHLMCFGYTPKALKAAGIEA